LEVQIKKITQKRDFKICYLPKGIFDALGLSIKVLYKLHVGQTYECSYVMSSQRNDNNMYLPGKVFEKLLLVEDLKLNIWRKGEVIYLGPVVGILVNTSDIEDIKNGCESLCIQKHGKASKEAHCLSYNFSIDDINWVEEKIEGYTFDSGTNKWIQGWFPLPDVLYDRAGLYTEEQIPLETYALDQFKTKYNIHFINNHGFLSKWEIHNSLSKHSELNKYLPKTIIYSNFNDVISMLKEYKFIFIKASVGCRGKQVVSLEQIGKRFKLNFYYYGLKEIILERTTDLKVFVERFVYGGPCLIQQGIRLLKYNGRNMDTRVLMERNGEGKWECAQIFCRIAQEKFTITNCATGADCEKYEDIYPHLRSQVSNKNIPDSNELVDASKKILYFIEKEFGSFGEFGIDMAIDIYGHIWFIEANTRPDKLLIPSLYGPEDIPAQSLRIFEYAKFLVNQSTPE
jgi:hypothetical protein